MRCTRNYKGEQMMMILKVVNQGRKLADTISAIVNRRFEF